MSPHVPAPVKPLSRQKTWSALVLLGLAVVLALWLVWSSTSLQARGTAVPGNVQLLPQDLVPLDGVVQVAAGGKHTCALTTAGGVKCWGDNYAGQVGDGGTGWRTTPVDVVGLGSGVAAIAAGGSHTCALSTAGGVKCWGANSYGQLGDGSTGSKSTPVDVVGLGSGVVAIAAGAFGHTCALSTAGGVKCWGNNGWGQLGDGSTANKSTPVEVVGLGSGVAAIAAGGGFDPPDYDGSHTCALSTAGEVKCWGRNWAGQLGDGSTANKSTPVEVVGLGSGVAAIAAGGSHTCALSTAGGAKCWGWNLFGQVGDGTAGWETNKTTPVDVAGLGSGMAAIAAGQYHTCSLSTAGGVKCWGSGQLGDGSTGSKSTPVDVVGLGSGVAVIAAGSGHTCALGTAGGVKCWGYNDYGQLGDSTTTDKSTPVEVLVEGTGSTTYHISGHISDGDGNPIADVIVSDGVGHSATTGSNGNYDFSDLSAGTYTITAARDGYTFAPSSRSITLPPNSDNADFTGFSCTAPPSGLDLCNLQSGDILLKASPALGEGSSTDSFFIRLGGTYFTHSALYLGIVPDPGNPDKFAPRIAEAQGVAGGPDDVWETVLENTRFWSGDIVTDWAVVRPSVGQSVKNSAISYARNKAAEDGVVFDINAERSDEKKFYCSKLVWRAYDQAGFKVDERRRFLDPASRFGWVTPEDLYYGSPEVQSKSTSLGRQILKGFFGIYSPAHLTLTDAQGRQTGYDPTTGESLFEIPGSMYSGPDSEIESIHVADIGDTAGWQLTATGYEDGGYTLETGYVDPRTTIQIVHDVTSPGKIDTFPVSPPMYSILLPLVVR